MKRFWANAGFAEQDGGFIITLDGKPMRLPGGPALRLRHRALAAAIAAEWQAAGDVLSVDDLPLTRLAGTAQDRIEPDPAPTAAALAAYGAHDLLCYRAAHPEALAIRQHHAWQPWLDWAATRYGARLALATSIMPVTQQPEALAALHRAVAGLGAWPLAALSILVPGYGSLVLGLAVAAGALEAGAAHTLSVLDELFQESKWGADADALARRQGVAADVAMAARFLALSLE